MRSLVLLLVTLLAAVGAVSALCPDGITSCPSSSTCCVTASGWYGCCPLPSATCCADHVHCCPNGYICNTTQSICTPASGEGPIVAMVTKTPAIPVKSIECGDGITYCSSSQTCCLLSGGSYGCCPLPNATCCADHVHCCPNGYTCDTTLNTCKLGDDADSTVPMMTKQPAIISKPMIPEVAVVCPDNSQCSATQTCCKMSNGSYGCCPLPNASCCADHLHCCPSGFTCDVTDHTCNNGLFTVPALPKLPSTPRKN
ncbi:grn protein [Capsaspora owczarzaki ATCC 30864]|uniref:Grn protein n=1 Tax=Capsaspora owczarzaki (strain ATCC 30864) TaxID=595528 RepID=A0A0D2WJS4_CAPO3|nr:grn protein [Capsaspora owczarzaki ATCC 30864]KJE89663.1 grn protein [Capsaspora owczarzaki ATCC 30864]|eukprot:XP_004365969.2 grn protein [Capsaspora owczarzaki ATCC 30864]